MNVDDLVVDCEIHKAIGMTVISKEVVNRKRLSPPSKAWPKDKLFDPRGITFEEAQGAMKKCLG